MSQRIIATALGIPDTKVAEKEEMIKATCKNRP